MNSRMKTTKNFRSNPIFKQAAKYQVCAAVRAML